MFNQNHPCDDSSLAILLQDDESNDEFLKCAAHVETCELCQQRLTAMAGDGATWSHICGLLAGYPSDPAHAGDAAPSIGSGTGLPELDFLSESSHPELLGRIGRYEIERVIGSGGMGVVLKGFDSELNRPVAIKLLARHLAYSGAARQRFAREARAAAAVVHEHVVAIHNVEPDGEVPFLVMQYVPGESLQSRVDREGPLDSKEILRIGMQAAAGLSAAHEQGVIHRDVKPANILLENSVERALLTDFGLARTVDDASLTHTGVVAGTPHYMSPEQASGIDVDHRTDLFSLGAVIYYAATGHPPFRAERAMGVLNRICHDTHRPVWQVNPDIPDALSDIIDRLLAKRPERRFATADDARRALAKLLNNVQRRGFSSGRRNRLLRYTRHHRGRILAAATVLMASMVLASLFPMFSAREDPKTTHVVTSGDASVQVSEAVLETERVEFAEYESAISEIESRIQELESRSRTGSYLTSSGDDWSEATGLLNVKLNQLQEHALSTIDPSQSQGESQ